MRRFPVGQSSSAGKARLKEPEGEFWMVEYTINDGATEATIKPDSDKTSSEGAAIKAALNLKMAIGSHTNKVGSPQANEKLSGERTP